MARLFVATHDLVATVLDWFATLEVEIAWIQAVLPVEPDADRLAEITPLAMAA